MRLQSLSGSRLGHWNSVRLCLAALFIFALNVQVIHAQPLNPNLLQVTANPEIRQGYVDSEYGQIHFWSAGDGPSLLMIHQSTHSGEEYAGLVPYLSDRFRVVAFDWPGHGMSDDPTRELHVEDLADVASAVLKHLSIERTHVLGNHGGALIAMHLAWQQPDLVDQLILVGMSAPKRKAEAKAFVESLQLGQRKVIDRSGKSLMQAWERYLDYMPESEAQGIVRSFVHNVISRVRPFDAHHGVLKYNRFPALKAIKNRRILIMQGANDPFVSGQEALMEMLPNAQRVVVAGGGVFQFYEQAHTSAEALSTFLEQAVDPNN